jgi:hypothetical protein
MSETQKSPSWNFYELKGVGFLRRLKGKTLTIRQAFFILLLLIFINKALDSRMVGRLFGFSSSRYTANDMRNYSSGFGGSTDRFRPSSPPPGAPSRDESDEDQLSRLATTNRAGGPNVIEVFPQDATGGAMAKAVPVDRRIIYTATVDLISESLAIFEPKLLEMIKAAGGFVSGTNQTGSTGGQRSATWRVRVPVTEYDGFLQKARTLGEVQSVVVNSQDVTEEFVDVSARVSTKKIQEQRLIELIKNATAKLEEILKVESELARVRGEIERMEGRIRFLKDQTELTTVTISVREVLNYKPPEAPTFATKLMRTWNASTQTFSDNTSTTILWMIAWVPFLPIYIVVFGLGSWIARRLWHKSQPWLMAHLVVPPKSDKGDEPPTSSTTTPQPPPNA